MRASRGHGILLFRYLRPVCSEKLPRERQEQQHAGTTCPDCERYSYRRPPPPAGTHRQQGSHRQEEKESFAVDCPEEKGHRESGQVEDSAAGILGVEIEP